MKILKFLLICIFVLNLQQAFANDTKPTFDAKQAIEELKNGNERYTHFRMKHPHQDIKTLIETSKEQHPFAAIITCSDSRLSPEIIFDQGVGDLFVIRVAGNVLSYDEIASIEYAVSHLHIPLVLVLGHTHCGAITAIIENEKLTPSLRISLRQIKKAKRIALKKDGDLTANTTIINVNIAVSAIKSSKPILKSKYEDAELGIIGGIYDVKTGKVNFIEYN